MYYLLIILLSLMITNYVKKVDKQGTLLETYFFKVGYLIAWYDMWLGFYKSTSKEGKLYIMIPTMGITIKWINRSYKRYVVFAIPDLQEVIVMTNTEFEKSFALTQLAQHEQRFFMSFSARIAGKKLAKDLNYQLNSKVDTLIEQHIL